MDTVFLAKIKPNAKIPTKRDEDGCYDLYACFDEDDMVILPNKVKLVPTGLSSAFDPKYRIAFRERGTNTRCGLVVMAGQIDSGYRGEWFVALLNTSNKPIVISKEVDDIVHSKSYNIVDAETYFPYSKAICQFAVEDVPKVEINEIAFDELSSYESERMFGKLGSSNK